MRGENLSGFRMLNSEDPDMMEIGRLSQDEVIARILSHYNVKDGENPLADNEPGDSGITEIVLTELGLEIALDFLSFDLLATFAVPHEVMTVIKKAEEAKRLLNIGVDPEYAYILGDFGRLRFFLSWLDTVPDEHRRAKGIQFREMLNELR